MINDDLLPESPKARAILAALSTLRDAGIDAALRTEPGDLQPFQIALGHDTPGSIGELSQCVHAALEYQWQTAAAHLTMIQAKGARP